MDTETGKPAQTGSRPSRWRWLRAPFWSPKGFAARAAAIAVLYLLLSLLGWSECTSVVCGTSPTGNVTDSLVIFKGCAYALMHFLFVLGVPMLLIAAGLFTLLLERSVSARACAVASGQ